MGHVLGHKPFSYRFDYFVCTAHLLVCKLHILTGLGFKTVYLVYLLQAESEQKIRRIEELLTERGQREINVLRAFP